MGLKSLLSLFSLSACLSIGFSSCTFPFADDTLGRAKSSSIQGSNLEYRTLDNAIYDTLSERYGEDRVQRHAYPEKEYHRWVVLSDEEARGLEHYRIRIEGRPQKGGDGNYVPEIKVIQQVRKKENDFAHTAVRDWAANDWLPMGTDTTEEVQIINEVNSKLRQWRAAGKPDTGSRIEEHKKKNRQKPSA